MVEQHVAIFMGEKRHQSYRAEKGYYENYWNKWNEPKISKISNLLAYEEIVKVNLDNPPLQIGDSIYINKLNNKYKVIDIARSTNNEHIYYVDYVSEIIEDNETIESRHKAEGLLVEYWEEFKKNKQDYETKMTNRVEEILNPKKWYQFWK